MKSFSFRQKYIGYNAAKFKNVSYQKLNQHVIITGALWTTPNNYRLPKYKN